MRTLSILKKVPAVLAASVVAITATTGKASAITFSLGGSTSTASSFTYNQDNVTLTATGRALVPVTNAPVSNVQVNRLSNGLGVNAQILPFVADNDVEIDGVGAVETLRLSFNTLVKLTSVTFARVGYNLVGTSIGAIDNYRLLVDGTQVSTGIIPGANASDTGSGTLSFNTQFGQNFDFTIPYVPVLGQSLPIITDEYIVSSVNVEAVPEPITIAGMVMGSGFGLLLRRKYKKAAK